MVAIKTHSSHCEELPTAWIAVRDGRLLMEATGPLLSRLASDTRPILISLDRLAMLLQAVESEDVALVFPDSISTPLGIRSDGYTALLMPLDRVLPARKNLEEQPKRVLQVESISPDEDGDYSVLSP